MTKQEGQGRGYLKALLPIIAVAMAIALWKNGYAFGQWLHRMFN